MKAIRRVPPRLAILLNPMPEFCDVALPVPLDMVFTYHVPAKPRPSVGGRVLVPFRQQRMTGIVTEIHDRKPSVTTKNVLSVLDPAPVLDEQLLQLGRWIADYYLAPIGEVFRTMLPLGAEFKRIHRISPHRRRPTHAASGRECPDRLPARGERRTSKRRNSVCSTISLAELSPVERRP